MTKIHGLNIFILFVWMMLTCGGLGNAAAKYDSIYWVPFIANIIVYGGFLYKIYKATAESKRVEKEEGR